MTTGNYDGGIIIWGDEVVKELGIKTLLALNYCPSIGEGILNGYIV